MPKWPVGLVQRLLPRKTEIVEQMPVIGEIARCRLHSLRRNHSLNSPVHPGHELN